MYDHLTDPNRTVENVTEWAKREISWKTAQKIDFSFEPEFVEELLNKKYVKTQEMAAVREVKEINEMTALIDVYKMEEEDPGFWKLLFDWGTRENIWNYQDVSFLKLAMKINTNPPSDKQAIRIMQLLEKARSEAFPK